MTLSIPCRGRFFRFLLWTGFNQDVNVANGWYRRQGQNPAAGILQTLGAVALFQLLQTGTGFISLLNLPSARQEIMDHFIRFRTHALSPGFEFFSIVFLQIPAMRFRHMLRFDNRIPLSILQPHMCGNPGSLEINLNDTF